MVGAGVGGVAVWRLLCFYSSLGVILSRPLSHPLPSLVGAWVAAGQGPVCAPHALNCGVGP